MKQLSFAILLFFFSTLTFAQETNTLIKKWKLSEVEEFGEKYAPTDAQINDYIEFTADNKYSGKISGSSIEGSWSEKAGKYTLVPNKEKSVYKVNWIKMISVDAGKLVVNFQSTDLIQTKLGYVPAN